METAEWIPSFNITYILGVDGLSLPMVILMALIGFISVFVSWNINTAVKGYFSLFLLLNTGVMGVFLSLDFFLFYIFWEVMLLPMYFLIGMWGGPQRCLLYTSDVADEEDSVDLGGRRIIKNTTLHTPIHSEVHDDT